MKDNPTDFLTEKEIEDLQAFERISKKSIQKTDDTEEIEPIPEIKKPKRKPIEKLEKDVKAIVPKSVSHKIVNEYSDIPIDFTIKTVVKYDLNWFYVKRKFISLKIFILLPYTMYANWFNRSFNTKTIIKNVEIYDNISEKWIDLEAIQEFKIKEV